MGVLLQVGSLPNHHPLAVWQVLSHPSPVILAEPCRTVGNVPLGRPVEPVTLDRRVHPEAFSEEGVEVELPQRLWTALPFPGEVIAVWPRRKRLLGGEPHQDGEDL